MSTIKVDNLDTRTGTGNITLNRPLVGDGSGLTSLTAANLTGIVADARFPATLPAASGVNLTALNASNISSGTLPAGRYTDTVYTHPTTAGNKHIPSGGATNQVLTYSSSGTASWAALAAGGWVHLATAANSSQTEFTFVSVMDTTYDMYAFVLREVQHNAPNGDLQFQVSDDNGSTYKTSGYHHATRGHDTGGTVRQDNSTNSSSIIIAPDTAAIGNLGFNGVVYLNSLSTYASTHFHGMYRGQTAAANVYVVGCGIWSSGSLGVINAVKFKPSISTFNGSIYCFGITKS